MITGACAHLLEYIWIFVKALDLERHRGRVVRAARLWCRKSRIA